MKTPRCLLPASLLYPSGGWFGRALQLWPAAKVDCTEVLLMADKIERNPDLQRWLLTAASLPPKARRELLTRAAQAFVGAPSETAARLVTERLQHARWQDAVIDELFARHGLEPLPATQRWGRLARARLTRLAELLQPALALS